MQQECGFTVFGDGFSANAAHFHQVAAAQHRRRAAEVAGIPEIQRGVDGAVEHVILAVGIANPHQVLFHRSRVNEEVRGLHQKQLGVGEEITHRALQHVGGWHMVAIQHQHQFSIGVIEGVIEVTCLGVAIGFARDVIDPQLLGHLP